VLAQQDEITTAEGTLTLTPILHSTMALEFKGKTIFVDPYGGAGKFEGLGGQFSDVDAFKVLVNGANPSIEVRIRDWYVN